MYWLTGRHSQLSSESKIAIYKPILKPVWTYDIQLWRTTKESNIDILERFQTKTLRTMLGIPYHISNKIIYDNLKINAIRIEIAKYSKNYKTRFIQHPKVLASDLLNPMNIHFRRLKRSNTLDLTHRF
ncbi:hypothetical protein RF55_14266 [Lasius niger]|uniref:Uncharacterized protein n=1 Tax=Lasius niger TaxID=67767 RepID=A0A0J7K8M6_LASNI|nr:hypothetical protein RF55_14266 [Lasius niger]